MKPEYVTDNEGRIQAVPPKEGWWKLTPEQIAAVRAWYAEREKAK